MRATAQSVIVLMAITWFGATAYGQPAELPLNTAPGNFFIRGTQPNGLAVPIVPANQDCLGCHGGTLNIYGDWTGSLKAQAARDPVFYACLDIAEADAPGIGETCIRCHAPRGWLDGRSTPSDGSALTFEDRDGVTCNFCHRLVDPLPGIGGGAAPPPDAQILSDLGANAPIQSFDLGNPPMPGGNGNGGYVIDPQDRRRGPFPLAAIPGAAVPPEVNCEIFHPLGTFESPLHETAAVCASCHDVGVPHFHPVDPQQSAFVFNGTGVAHPTGNKYEMIPEQRTFSEWLKSDFANGGVLLGDRFGGPGQVNISKCQHCHMSHGSAATACDFEFTPRDDLGQHQFSGAATWVLDAIKRQWGSAGLGELGFGDEQGIDANILRNDKMLRCAADLEVFLDSSQTPGIDQLLVRVTNQTGHKLPTGYPEGRRMFLTVQYFDCTDNQTPFIEFGGYDPVLNQLDEATTKVYEAKFGIDAALATQLNRPQGPSFHVAVSNKVFKDNRIPPRGFTNAGFAAIQAAPVGQTYADGQFWDDTFFQIPGFAVGVRVLLQYESSSRSYIDFLYLNNPFFGTPGNRGETLFNLWDNSGNRPQPVVMQLFPPPGGPDDGLQPCTLPTIDPTVFDPDGDGLFDVELRGDANGDRLVDLGDIPAFVSALIGQTADARVICAADMDANGASDGLDIDLFVGTLMAP